MASRFFVPPEQIHNQKFTLLGSEARHAALVLRKKVGDVIDLFDGKDLAFEGRIESVSAERIDGLILSRRPQTSASAAQLILFQALIKGPKWDWLVEKACEIGVTRLVPLLTARTIVKPSRPDAEERWKRIALAASKQCGRPDLMEVDAPVSLTDALEKLPKDGLALIPWEKENSKTIRQAFSSSPAATGRGSMDSPPAPAGNDGKRIAMRISLFIGPEGGWETEEVKRAERHGAVPVRLGPTLLRSETAGLVAAALVLAELGLYA